MVYIDTNVLVAYYCPEPLSEKAEKLLISYLKPAISSLTEVEFFSAVSGKVRKKEINSKDAGRVTARFLAHMDADLTSDQRLFKSARILAQDATLLE